MATKHLTTSGSMLIQYLLALRYNIIYKVLQEKTALFRKKIY